MLIRKRKIRVEIEQTQISIQTVRPAAFQPGVAEMPCPADPITPISPRSASLSKPAKEGLPSLNTEGIR